MHKRNNKYYVIIDNDRKLFNVIECGNDDREWNKKVEAARKQNPDFKRDITAYSSEKTEDVIKEDQQRLGKTYTKDSVLLPYE